MKVNGYEVPEGLQRQYAQEAFFNRMLSFIEGIEYGLQQDGVARNMQHAELYKQAFKLAQAHTVADTGYKFDFKNLYPLTQTTPNLTAGMIVSENMITPSNPLTPVQQQVVAGQIPELTAQFNALKQNPAYAGLNAVFSNINTRNNAMPNFETWIKEDLYESKKDVGIFTKRLFTEDFYTEHSFIQVTEALYKYTGDMHYASSEKQAKLIPLLPEEMAYKEALQKAGITDGELFQIGVRDTTSLINPKTGLTEVKKASYVADKIKSSLFGDDPDEFREFAKNYQMGVDRELRAYKMDRAEMRQAETIMREAEKQNKTLFEIVDKSYKNTALGQKIIEAQAGNDGFHDGNVRQIMRDHLMDPSVMKEPILVPSSSIQNNQRMMDSLSLAKMAMYDENVPEYADFRRYREISQAYTGMIQDLRNSRSLANAENFLYVGAGNDKVNHSVFSYEEADAIYKESNRWYAILDANEEADKRRVAAIELQKAEGRELPQQPMNRFRNAFAEYFIDTGSETAQKAAKMTEMELRGVLKAEKYDAESMGHIISEKSFNGLKETWKDIEKRNVSVLSPAERNTLNAERWETAMENDQRIRVRGSEIAYRIRPVEVDDEVAREVKTKDFREAQKKDTRLERGTKTQAVSKDGYVVLEREHELVRDARIKMNVEEAHVKNILDRMNERRIRSSVDQEAIREMNDMIHEDAFINVRYTQEQVSEEMKKKSEFLYEKMDAAHRLLQEQGLVPKNGDIEVNLHAQDITDALTSYRKNLSELDAKGIEKRMGLSSFLLNMAESHAPWMMDNSEELISHSELGLRQVLDRIAKGQETIDLTDAGLIREWERYAPKGIGGELTAVAEKEKEKFIAGLGERNLQQRLEDNLFLKVLGQTIENNFEEKGRNGGILNLLRSAQDMATQNGRRGTGRDVYAAINDDATKILFRDHGYYAKALQLSAQEIDTMLREDAAKIGDTVSLETVMSNRMEFDGEGDDWRVAAREHGYGDDLEDWAKTAKNLEGGEDIHGAPKGDAALGQIYDEGMETRATSVYGNPEQSALLKYGSAGQNDYKGGRLSDEADVIARSKSQIFKNKEEELLQVVKERRLKEFMDNLHGEGVQFHNLSDVETMLDVAKEMNLDGVEATVRDQPAYIYRGEQGDVIAHLLRDDVKVQMVDSSVGLTQEFHVNDSLPQKFYGGAAIKEEIGQGGAPVRNQYTSYNLLQGSGDYARSTNPGVTVEAFHNFLQGKGKMTYLDIETTGLSGSTLPAEVIQPLELHMQKAEWDTEKGGLRVNGDGEYVIKHGGNEMVREKQLIMALKPETSAFLKDVVANETFQFKVGDKTFDIVDYENNKGAINKLIEAHPNAIDIRKEVVQKQDKMWFLRNIAKYAFPGINEESPATEILRYRQYAGNSDLPEHGKDFIEQLKADARQAEKNLKSGAKFSDVQTRTTEEGMLKHITKFVGKSIVAGQNVADADWSKFLGIADNLIAQAEAPYVATQNNLLNQIDEISKKHIEKTLDRLETVSGHSNMKNAGIQDRMMSAIDTMRSEVKDGKITSTTGLLNRFGEYANNFNNDAMKSAVFAMTDGSSEALGGMEAYQIQNRMNSGKEIDLFRQAVASGDFSSAPSWVQEGKTDRFLGKTGLQEGVAQMQAMGQEIERVKAIKANLPVPEIVEQMYLYSMVNPNAKGRSAEDQFAKMNVKVDTSSGLHLARADVQNNLKLIDAYGKHLSQDKEFMGGTERLQSGDLIELHTSIDKKTPLGIYKIDNVDLDNSSMTFTRQGTDESFTVFGKNNADLSRKVNTNFSYIKSGGVDEAEAVERLTQDQARRQIQRASSNADVFDKYEAEIKQLNTNGELTHDSLRNMQNVYETARDKVVPAYGPAMDPNQLTMPERVALKNAELFEGDAILDMLDEKASHTKQLGFSKTEDWMSTPEAQARRDFLNEVRSMQEAGVMDRGTGDSIIKQWNESLKEEGMRRGAKHSVFNKANLGTLDDRFGKMKGTQFIVDTSSPQRALNDIWSLAERSKGLTNELEEGAAKKKAIESLILPFLKENGAINNFKAGNEPSLNSVVTQLLNRKDQLAKLEEYDPIKSGEMSLKDTEYQQFMEARKEELLAPHREAMTDVQRQRQANYEFKVNALKEDGLFDPRLQLDARAADVSIDSLRFGNYGGLTQAPTGVLANAFKALGDLDVTDKATIDARDSLASELFYRATNNQRFDIQETINSGDSSKLEAMKALNWVTEDNKVNENIAEHIYGINNDKYANASMQMGEMSKGRLDEIAQEEVGDYTRGNAKSSIKGKIEQWKETYDADGREYAGRFDSAPDNKSRQRQMNVRDNLASEVEATKKGGAAGGTERMSQKAPEGDKALNYIRENLDPSDNHNHTNAISEALRSAKEKVSNAGNWASEAWHGSGGSGGIGKAAKWVAGLGVAAYAINQFMSAGSPMKLERKPMAHGVEGATGQANDGLNAQAPSTGGKTYANSGSSQPPAGYEIKVNGTANGDVDYEAMNKQINKTIGNFNTNLSDDRSTFNRQWLEKQFGDYIDRGYVGQE